MTSKDGGNAEGLSGTIPAHASEPLICASGADAPINNYFLGMTKGNKLPKPGMDQIYKGICIPNQNPAILCYSESQLSNIADFQ